MQCVDHNLLYMKKINIFDKNYFYLYHMLSLATIVFKTHFNTLPFLRIYFLGYQKNKKENIKNHMYGNQWHSLSLSLSVCIYI